MTHSRALRLPGNLVLAALGGKDRARGMEIVPIAAAAKAAVDATLAAGISMKCRPRKRCGAPIALQGRSLISPFCSRPYPKRGARLMEPSKYRR
jgi:hypothetical protein